MAVGSVPGSILLVQYLEGHGYLEWGARLDLELVAQVIVGALALFAVLMGFAIRKRSPRRRPGIVGFKQAGWIRCDANPRTHTHRQKERPSHLERWPDN
jgi:hypothetical protein